MMVLKAAVQKEGSKQSLPNVTSEAAYGMQPCLKETSIQVLFCEYCEIFANINGFFHRIPPVTLPIYYS